MIIEEYGHTVNCTVEKRPDSQSCFGEIDSQYIVEQRDIR